MPILSKCIAGHARLVMTLYYTKAGITYVPERMAEAEQRWQNMIRPCASCELTIKLA